jgi:Protein of unknown function (DUF1279)
MTLPAFLSAAPLARPCTALARAPVAAPRARPAVGAAAARLAARPARMCAQPAGGAPGGRPKTAKDTLARYGGAYLGTSVALSLLSFGVLYVAIDAGVDVKPGLRAFGDFLAGTPLGRPAALDSIGETGSTMALAYIAHKVTSPLRFPPTLLLTEFVAKAVGKDTGDTGAAGDK